jgi:carbon storage regulator CsrA
MLVLSRRANEALVIAGSITVRVLEVRAEEVHLQAERGTNPGRRRRAIRIPARRRMEGFGLPGNVSVRIVDIASGVVRLGIQAPPEVAILRGELWQTPRRTNIQVVPLEAAIADARGFLNAGQREHLKDIWQRLQEWGDTGATRDLRVEKVENLWQLKVRGSVLGRINVRVFFSWVPARREIVILGAIKKEEEVKTPRHVVIRMQNRLRVYLNRLAR